MHLPLAHMSLRHTLIEAIIFPVKLTLIGCLLLNGATVVSMLRTALVLLTLLRPVTIMTVHAFVLPLGSVFGCWATSLTPSSVASLPPSDHHLIY